MGLPAYIKLITVALQIKKGLSKRAVDVSLGYRVCDLEPRGKTLALPMRRRYMNFKQALATVALTGAIGLTIPAAPVMADGAASTRNIIFGAAAAAGTLLIINHNRKVHEKYAEDARRQAALQSENNDAWAAYRQEQRAYQQQAAVNADLKREIAYQHKIVEDQRRQLASLSMHTGFVASRAGVDQPHRVASRNNAQQVAMVSYGWGQL